MHVAVIGTGYVGLVTGACFANFGINVVCVDNDSGKIDAIRAGKLPIYEPGLPALVEKNVKESRLEFTTEIREAVERSLVVFLAVGTPTGGDGSADLSQIEKVASACRTHVRPNDSVRRHKNRRPRGASNQFTTYRHENTVAESDTQKVPRGP